MSRRYPPIEPYEHGMLDVGDGNHVYWETCGNPEGAPALVLHGGPGSGCRPGSRRHFDPQAYRIVQLDQRGCGRSTPHAADYDTDMSVNTTDHLVADIERLREHLGVTDWVIYGASWGSVLGLTYAERHPDRVRGLVLAGVATGRRAETDLLSRGIAPIFPEAWARFRDGVPESERDGDLTAAYARLLADPDPAVRERAAVGWCTWEDSNLPGAPHNPRYDDPRFRMAFARIVTHYWSQGSWLEEGAVIRDAGRLAGIPGVIVQGTLDLNNLVGTPWELTRAWPGSELVLLDNLGHDGGQAMLEAIVEATDRMATVRA